MNINKINRRKCIIALVLCSLVFLSAGFALLVGITADGDYVYLGLDNLHYFTYESNIFVAICSFLCIPFQIDGLRNRNYHLPRWLIDILYVSVCTSTITLLLAAVFVLPYKGFYLTYLDKGNLFVHLFTPLLAIIMFVYINDNHYLKKITIAYAYILLVLYALIYIHEVFFFDNWLDHYHIVGYMPPVIACLLVTGFYGVVAIVIRNLHNKRHELTKKQIKDYYINSDEVAYEDIKEAIKHLAINNRKYYQEGDIVVPKRIILMMEDKYQSHISLDELCAIYLKEFLR